MQSSPICEGWQNEKELKSSSLRFSFVLFLSKQLVWLLLSIKAEQSQEKQLEMGGLGFWCSEPQGKKAQEFLKASTGPTQLTWLDQRGMRTNALSCVLKVCWLGESPVRLCFGNQGWRQDSGVESRLSTQLMGDTTNIWSSRTQVSIHTGTKSSGQTLSAISARIAASVLGKVLHEESKASSLGQNLVSVGTRKILFRIGMVAIFRILDW